MEAPPLPAFPMVGLLEASTAQRLARALGGFDESRRLTLADLQPGDVGVVDAWVRQVHPVREFTRRAGGTGLLGKVTLADSTGEAVLLLWDEETRHLDGVFVPGARLRLQGLAVRAARDGGCELGLGTAVVTQVDEEPVGLAELAGTLVAVGPTRILGDPPRERFQADVRLDTRTGPANIVAEGELLRSLRAILPGARIRLGSVAPHPALEGWYLAGPNTAFTRT